MGLLAILSTRGWRFAFDSNPRAIQHQKFYFYKGTYPPKKKKERKCRETLIGVGLTSKKLSNVYSLEDIVDVQAKQTKMKLNSHCKVFSCSFFFFLNVLDFESSSCFFNTAHT